MLTRSVYGIVTVAAACAIGATTASAAVVEYTIDQSQSSLFAGGTLAGSTAIGQDGFDDLTAAFRGTIRADRTGNTILFNGGSSIQGVDDGSKEPDEGGLPGEAPAAYGRESAGQFGSTNIEAIRQLVLDLFVDEFSSGGITLAPNGTFASNSLVVQINEGVSDYVYLNQPDQYDFGAVNPPDATSNGASTPSKVERIGDIERLTLEFQTGPIAYDVPSSNGSTITFTGTIVAERVVPEPAAAGVVVAIAGFASLARRRRRTT